MMLGYCARVCRVSTVISSSSCEMTECALLGSIDALELLSHGGVGISDALACLIGAFACVVLFLFAIVVACHTDNYSIAFLSFFLSSFISGSLGPQEGDGISRTWGWIRFVDKIDKIDNTCAEMDHQIEWTYHAYLVDRAEFPPLNAYLLAMIHSLTSPGKLLIFSRPRLETLVPSRSCKLRLQASILPAVVGHYCRSPLHSAHGLDTLSHTSDPELEALK